MSFSRKSKRLRKSFAFVLATLMAFAWNLAFADEGEQAQADQAQTEQAQAEEKKKIKHRQDDQIKLGGALRFNLFYKSWIKDNKGDANAVAGNHVAIDTFRLNYDLFYQGMLMSAEYRFYNGYSMLHHGYVGYAYEDLMEFQAGIVQAPFGNLTWASHNWFFILPYYVGLEDDYDMGLKYILTKDGFNFQTAFMFNDEGSFTGNSADSARYSYDVVLEGIDLDGDGVDEYGGFEEKYQGNVRLAYTIGHAKKDDSEEIAKKKGSTEIGISGELGGLYAAGADDFGSHYAGAFHLDSSFYGVNLQFETMYYGHSLPCDDPAKAVVMGAYDFPYLVAKDALLVGGGLAYTLPIEKNLVDYIQLYFDASYMYKPEDGFEDTVMLTPGFLLAATYIYMYTDFAIGKNHPWIGGAWTTGLAQGDPNADFEYRVNVNLGFYYSGIIKL